MPNTTVLIEDDKRLSKSAQTKPPQDILDLIVRLAKQENVHSVSCPFTDYGLWCELVTEQVKRSLAQGIRPELALALYGPDDGIPLVHDEFCRVDREWGGDIHIPYEGVCSADLFIQPRWFGFDVDYARIAPSLNQAVFGVNAEAYEKSCAYLLTPWLRLGEFASAKKVVVGDWALYGPKT